MTKRFTQTTRNGLLSIGMACMLLLTACVEKDIFNGPEDNGPSKEDFFDFSTTGIYTLDINYGLKDYPVLFELYTSNPMILADDHYAKAENIQPIYRAATDQSGKFKGDISLPAYAKTIYLYCHYLGTVRCAELTINGNSISFDQQTYLAELSTRSGITTRATTSQGYTIPNNYLTLGGWTDKGKVDYLSNGEQLPGDFLARLTKSIVKKQTSEKDFVTSHPSPDISITQPTSLSTVIIYSDAAHEVTVGYFTYPTGQAPSSPAQITNPIILFPAVSTSMGNADIGDEVKLKYWNKTTGKYEDEFPAGVSISFFFMVDAFKKNKGDIIVASGKELEEEKLSQNVDYIFYSNSSLNQKLASKGKKDAQRTVTMSDGNGLAAICFEADLKKAFTVGSWDYTDVIMSLRYAESATNTPMPELPGEKEVPSNKENYYGLSGTIAFEDQWPSKGDYDMNDMVIYYNSTVYKDVSTNKILKVVDEITTRHSGASYVNGFGYQFHKIRPSDVSSVTVATESGLTSAFMKGEMLEPAQDHPTIILFDNMNEAVKKLASFTVTTTFAGDGINEMDVLPPYNPFLIAQTGKGRGTEIHLTNYPPTSLADRDLLGKGDDLSNANIGLYYVSNENYPFAICLNSAYFQYPEEKQNIAVAYPNFASWLESKGVSNKDWYIK